MTFDQKMLKIKILHAQGRESKANEISRKNTNIDKDDKLGIGMDLSLSPHIRDGRCRL